MIETKTRVVRANAEVRAQSRRAKAELLETPVPAPGDGLLPPAALFTPR